MEFFSHYSSLMALFSGSRCRVGFHTTLVPRGRLLTHRVPFNPHRYITEAFQALGQKIGAQKEYPLFSLAMDETHVRHISGWINDRRLRSGGYVVVNTHGSDHLGELKHWPSPKWSALIALIVESLELPVILTGVKVNRDDIEEVRRRLPGSVRDSVYNTAGDLSLRDFLALLRMSRFLITIDSGPLHLSQCLGVPSVALFGPETPVLYGPRGIGNRTVYQGLYCSPCCNVLEGKKAECTNTVFNECMTGIEVDRVWCEVVDLHRSLEGREFDP
jgi:ADP-heptose:LPS heptosyltransferase